MAIQTRSWTALLIGIVVAVSTGGTVSSQPTAPKEGPRVEPGGGQAQTLLLDVSTITARGEPQGCSLNYRVAYEDFTYRNGGLSLLNLSIELNIAGKQPDIMLKVTGYDLVSERLVLFPIDYAYFQDATVSSAQKEFVKFTCEDGGFCSGYTLLDKLDLFGSVVDGMANRNFRISILRNRGSTDVKIPISNYKNGGFGEKYLAFVQCTQTIFHILAKNELK
jgi:hypothetical protein